MLPGQVIVTQQTVDLLFGGLVTLVLALAGGLTIWVRWYFGRFENERKVREAEAIKKAQQLLDEQDVKHQAALAEIKSEQDAAKGQWELLNKLVEAQISSSSLARAGFSEIKAEIFTARDAITNLAQSHEESIGVIEAQATALSDFRSTYVTRNERIVSNQAVIISMLNEIRALIQAHGPCDQQTLAAILQPLIDLYQTLAKEKTA